MGTLFDLTKKKNIQNRYGNLFNFNYPDIVVEHVCAMEI